MDANMAFCRLMLRNTMAEARTTFKRETIKEAWAIRIDHRTFEFQINVCAEFPKGFYWYDSADNAYHAKALGWGSAIESFKKRAKEA